MPQIDKRLTIIGAIALIAVSALIALFFDKSYKS